MPKFIVFLLLLTTYTACIPKDPPITPDPNPGTEPYFPPNDENWATTTPSSLSWNAVELDHLNTLLEENGTRAFIILVNGKIVVEEYFGKNLLNIIPFSQNTDWYWASAGKTLTSFIVGKAAEEGYLQLTDKTSQYLGEGWTSLMPEQEDGITIRHQLTMTSGLDDAVNNNFSTDPEDLVFKANPGTRWAYHNAPYTLLQKVVTQATGEDFDTYFDQVLKDKIGMDGDWSWIGDNHIYFSTARSMARYGWLIQNDGKWQQSQLLNPTYIENMRSPSQSINESYGYLWWLNGKSSFRLPNSQVVFPGSMTPHAPDDMYCGLGANGQYLCIIPSLNMVMVRMGQSPDSSSVPIQFLDDIWQVMNRVMP